ncbi:hypothetical protein BCT86_00110 [Vibrio breoganii]|uniref:glycosyltransferase family A protein n=1 Tax=Vibrio breoganii TaxID=553239 RepID=UPI000C830CCC|nr:glycosyltransferase family 2 protein [Vibrio breoganii]PML10618.1 hypothetical protein BCT86_00110 [Vibrio breoganii]
MKYEIIIPHFNSLETIGLLLSSIPKRSDLSVIIIDDNSDNAIYESLEKIVSSSKLNRIRLFRNSTGVKGAGACRNLGMRNSNARYFIFADSDDFFIEDAFKTIDRNIEQNPDSDILYFTPTSMSLIDSTTSDRHCVYENLVDDFLANQDQSIRYKYFVPWSKVIKSTLIAQNKIEFDEVIASNDVMFSLKIGHFASKINASKERIYCVTRGTGTLTVNRSKLIRDARFKVELCRLEYLYNNHIMYENVSVLNLLRNKNFVLNIDNIFGILKLYYNGVLTFLSSDQMRNISSPLSLFSRLIKPKK